MASVSIRINQAALTQLLHSPSGPVRGKVDSVRRETAAIAVATSPVATGLLRNSMTQDTRDEGVRLVAEVVFHADYSLYVMKGTKGPITPKRGQFLVFRGRGGQLVYARSVRGQEARPFLVDALKAASPWPVVVTN